MANLEHNVAAFGSGPHKALFDISISFRSELAADDHSARALIDALTDYIRAKVPGAETPEVSVTRK